MTCKLYAAFVDGSEIEEEFPNHELSDVQAMAEATPTDLLCRVEIEDCREIIIYQYRRKTTYVY